MAKIIYQQQENVAAKAEFITVESIVDICESFIAPVTTAGITTINNINTIIGKSYLCIQSPLPEK